MTDNVMTPSVAFLGFCDRASQVDWPYPQLKSHNIMGLRSVLPFFFPFDMKGLTAVFAIYDPPRLPATTLRILGTRGELVQQFDLTARKVTPNESHEAESVSDAVPEHVTTTSSLIFEKNVAPEWHVVTAPISKSAFIQTSGNCRVMLRQGESEICIGGFTFVAASCGPLTPERLSAIRADPNAARHVLFRVSCEKCKKTFLTYCGIDRNKEDENEGYVWHEELQGEVKCMCGALDFDTTPFRLNFQATLDRSAPRGDMAFGRMYEHSELLSICAKFRRLLDSEPKEEAVQVFLNDHPILLHQFAPQKIFYKSPILSKYKDDISILAQKGDLLLIELEAPSMRLITKEGVPTYELTHANGQVRDWLETMRDHRLSVLECIGLKGPEVGAVRGVVIAGRDAPYDRDALRTLKGHPLYANVDFYTYDDLLNELHGLAREFQSL